MLSLRDTGIGMEPKELVAIFEPFHQADSHRVRSEGGLGLGLALSKRLLEKHGGSITAASAGLGCGSVFTIELPLDQEGLATPPRPAKPVAATPTPHRVLIVDDGRDTILTLTILLNRWVKRLSRRTTGVLL